MRVSERFKVGITRYTHSDANELTEFQQRMWGEGAKQLDRERFAWRMERNPLEEDGQIGLWICRRKDAIVGQQAEIPYELRVDGKTQPAAWAIDLMVDPAWRMKGVGPGLTATQLEDNEVVTGLTQAPEALRAYMRAGWTDVGIIPTYVRPLAPGIDALVGARLTEVDRFDERVDEVWETAAPEYPVISTRNLELTRWRFDDHPEADEFRRFYLLRKGRAVGYVVLGSREHRGAKAAQVMDSLSPRRLLPRLLTGAAAAARQGGVRTLLCRTMSPGFRVPGFIKRGVDVENPLHLMAYYPEGRERIGEGDNWFLTNADSDLS